MARSTKSRNTKAKGEPAGLVQASLTLIEQQGWQSLTMVAVARAAQLSMAELYAQAPSKQALLARIIEALDQDVVARLAEGDSTQSWRDRVFDALITVFEALGPRKPALRVLYHDLRRDPSSWITAWSGLKRTAGWLVEAAGVQTSGLAAMAGRRIMAALISDTTRIWLEDNDDLGRTMAHVDRRLRRLESVSRGLPEWARPFGQQQTEDEDTAAGGTQSGQSETQPGAARS